MKHIKKYFAGFNTFAQLTVAIVLALLCLQGCKKYFDPPFVYEDQQVNVKKKRKVLFISIDGATGLDVKTIMPPKIASILPNSKYSWNAWSDAPVSDGGTWKNIMTGVNGGRHGVRDSTFEVPEGSDLEGAVTVYPTFIERLQASGKMKYSAAVTPWQNLTERLLIYADQPLTVASDVLVRDSAVAKIKEFRNDLVIANFNSVNKAGLTYGYSADVPEYKNALLQVDGYVGDLLDAVKSRKTYADEEWLVVITSNHGGVNKGFNSGTQRERNVFAIYYSPMFKRTEIEPIPVTATVGLTSKSTVATLPAADGAAYNPGATSDFTVQFKIMLKTKVTGTSHAVLLSKTSAAYGALNGWEFMWDATNQKFRVLLGVGSSTTLVYLYGTVNPDLNTWSTLALKIFTKDGKRYAQFFNNGKPAADPTDITGKNIGTNTTSLIAGSISSSLGTCSEIVNNIAIYNTALSDEAISNYVCQEDITSSDPYYANLVGYWPCSEASGSVFVNRSPLAPGKDLIVTGTSSWNMISSWSCQVPPAGSTAMFMQNSDIAPQIYYWFGAKIEDKWGLDGKVFLSGYESEFIK